MRRHPPRDSPSWTRVFGPTDAITRPPRSALARTITQFRTTELTQTTRVVRGRTGAFATVGAGAFVAVFVGAFATDFAGALVAGAFATAFFDDPRAGVRVVVRAGTRASVRVVDRAERDFTGAGVGAAARVETATRGGSRAGATAADLDASPFSGTAIDSRVAAGARVATISRADAGSRDGVVSDRVTSSDCATGSTTTGAESTTTPVGDGCVIESEIAATTCATDWIVESDATTDVESAAVAMSNSVVSTTAPALRDESRAPADESGFSTAASRAFETSAGGSS
jgi:hypothetical protein